MEQKNKIYINAYMNESLAEFLPKNPELEELKKIEVVWKDRKHIRIKISKAASITVLVSLGIPLKGVEQFVEDHIGWIVAKTLQVRQKYLLSSIDFKSGDHIYFLGYKYELKIEKIETKWTSACWEPPTTLALEEIKLSGRQSPKQLSLDTYTSAKPGILEIQSRDTSRAEIKSIVESEFSKYMERFIEKYAPIYESKFNHQIDVYIIKKYKARWGQLNSIKNEISLNLYLAMKPFKCIELVLAHEIAHSKVPNHSLEFKNYLSEHIGDVGKIKKLLTEHLSPVFLE